MTIGSRCKIDAGLMIFDRSKMKFSSFNTTLSTNNTLTFKIKLQAKSENVIYLFSVDRYKYTLYSRISPRIVKSFNSPFQRYSQHAYLLLQKPALMW